MTPILGSYLYKAIPNQFYFSFYLYLPVNYDGGSFSYPLVMYLQGGPINGPEPTPALLGAGPLVPLYTSDAALSPAGLSNSTGW